MILAIAGTNIKLVKRKEVEGIVYSSQRYEDLGFLHNLDIELGCCDVGVSTCKTQIISLSQDELKQIA
jgi:hypothetical protein